MITTRLLINDLDGVQKIISIGEGGYFMKSEPERTLLDERIDKNVDWDAIEKKLGGLSKVDGSIVFNQSDKDTLDAELAEDLAVAEEDKTIKAARKTFLRGALSGSKPTTIASLWDIVKPMLEEMADKGDI